MWDLTDVDIYGFTPLKQIVGELIAANVLIVASFLVGQLFLWDGGNFLIGEEPFPELPIENSVPLNWIELGMVVVLAFSFVMNVYYKLDQGVRFLSNMLCGCHIATLVYLCLLLTPSYQWGTYGWNCAIFITFCPVMALAAPDTADCTLFLQAFVFWLHHIALLLCPAIFLWTERFPMFTHMMPYFLVVCVGGLLVWEHYFQMVVGLFVKVNVNYCVFPPPGQTLFTGRWFRPKVYAFIGPLAIFLWFVQVYGMWVLKNLPTISEWLFAEPSSARHDQLPE
eukprot:TRINITY_DN9319_c0_g1_i1.p1 TRINITY_DN9319_c0_g1~~TRINITY_DN9319_c0_g1_i1.p1  ORF type:complete len:281 (-),score=23.56 TRINITY_DN9319_c0_g1_i1:721-1563(-)